MSDSRSSVEVLLFSVLRERVGHPAVTIEIDGPTTGTELLDDLAAHYPAIDAFRAVIRLAVNQAYAPESVVIEPGDEVALITPVSGG